VPVGAALELGVEALSATVVGADGLGEVGVPDAGAAGAGAPLEQLATSSATVEAPATPPAVSITRRLSGPPFTASEARAAKDSFVTMFSIRSGVVVFGDRPCSFG
jgi:hypothetical protein